MYSLRIQLILTSLLCLCVNSIIAQDIKPHFNVGVISSLGFGDNNSDYIFSESNWAEMSENYFDGKSTINSSSEAILLGPLSDEITFIETQTERNVRVGLDLGYVLNDHWELSLSSVYGSKKNIGEFYVPKTTFGSGGGTGGPATSTIRARLSADIASIDNTFSLTYFQRIKQLKIGLEGGLGLSHNMKFEPGLTYLDNAAELMETNPGTGINSVVRLQFRYSLNDNLFINASLGNTQNLSGSRIQNPATFRTEIGLHYRICGTCGLKKEMDPSHRTVPADQLTMPAKPQKPKMDPSHRTVPADQITMPAEPQKPKMDPSHRTVPADQITSPAEPQKPKMDPSHRTVPADQITSPAEPQKPKMDPSHRTVPADQITRPAGSENRPRIYTGEPCEPDMPTIGNAELEGELKQAKSKLTIYLTEGKAVWLEFEDGWREATWQRYTDPTTNESKFVWFANLEDKPIPKDKIQDRYKKSLVECVSEMSDSGLGMIFPGLDMVNAFNKGDYEGLAWEAGFELIPILGKAGKFIKILKFGCNAKYADEILDCAAESSKRNKRMQDAIQSSQKIIRNFPANGIAPKHAKAFSQIAKEKDYIIIVRNGNPQSIKYHNRIDCMPKPVTVKAKTAPFGPDAGLVVNPNNRLQKLEWDKQIRKMEGIGNTDRANELREKYEKAQKEWKKFEDRFKQGVDDKGNPVFSGGFKLDDRGRLTQNDKMIHGDYDLQGVYDGNNKRLELGGGGKQIENPDGSTRYTTEDPVVRRNRERFNEDFRRRSADDCDMIPHGAQDNWISPKNTEPGLPVTAFLPDGSVKEFSDIDELKKFYENSGLEWPYK